MLRRYSVGAVEQLTGEAPTKEVECDAYIIIGMMRNELGKWEEVQVTGHRINDVTVVNAMYSDKMLRRCALIMAEAHRMHNRPWRRLMRWLRGEQDEQEA